MPLINSLMKDSANRICCTNAEVVWKNNTCQSGGSGHSHSGWQQCMKDTNVDENKCAVNYDGQDPIGNKYRSPP